jgi:hypothetical protein
MAQTGFTPIQLYSSSTPTNTPAAGNLTNDTKGSELAVNIADGKLFYKDTSNNVQTIADKTWVGTVTSVSGTSPVAVATGTSTPVVSLSAGYGDTQNPYASKTANNFLAAPNGSPGAPTFRAIVAADIPTLNQNTTGSAATLTTARNLWGQSFNGSADISAPLYPAVGSVSLPAYSASGDTNTGIFFPAADTIAFSEGGVESMRIDSSGNVGIGTSSPNGKLDSTSNFATSGLAGVVASPHLSLTNAQNWGYPTGMVFRTPLANGGSVLNNAAIWSEFQSTNNAYLGFATYGSGAITERMRIPSTGGLQVVNCVSVGNATPSTSGAGITFPATASASSNANTLDDYEEGDWTPTITGLTLGNASGQAFKYTKVGNIVTVTIAFVWGSTTSSSGTWEFSVPFSSDSGGGGSAYLLDSGTAEYMVSAGIANISFAGIRIGTTATGFVSNTAPFTWATNDRFVCSVTYRTS